MGARLRTSRVHLGQLVSKIWRGSVRIVTSHIAVYTSDAEQVTGRNRACGLTFLGVHNRTIHSPRISPSLRHLARGFLPFESAHKDVCARYTGVTRREDVYACTPSVRTKVPSQSKNCLGWPKKHAHRTKCVEARSWVYRNRKSARCLHSRYYWIALRLCTLHLTNLWLFQLLHYKLSEKYL